MTLVHERLSIYGLFLLSDDIQLSKLKVKKIKNQLRVLQKQVKKKDQLIMEMSKKLGIEVPKDLDGDDSKP